MSHASFASDTAIGGYLGLVRRSGMLALRVATAAIDCKLSLYRDIACRATVTWSTNGYRRLVDLSRQAFLSLCGDKSVQSQVVQDGWQAHGATLKSCHELRPGMTIAFHKQAVEVTLGRFLN